MLDFLSAEQWIDWLHYAQLEPWGFDVDDMRMGILAATAASAFGAKTKPQDFMIGSRLPSRWGENEEIQRELVRAKVKSLFGWKPKDQRTAAAPTDEQLPLPLH